MLFAIVRRMGSDRILLLFRLLDIYTTELYYIGGGKTKDGFVGCMRTIIIDGNIRLPSDWKDEDYCCKGEMLFDACHMIDRCNPNPCKHSGVCRQNSMEFHCDCAGTGYAGAVCHTSLNPLSCQAYKNVNTVQSRTMINIDVDGSGPLAPFPVTCEFYSDGRVITVLSHSSEHTTRVDGFSEAGSFEQNIIYEADLPQIEALLNRSQSCWQRLNYACRSSRLFNSPSDPENFRPYSWWVSRHNQPMDYWAGALPGSRKCECGILGTCVDPTKWCNCDSNSLEWQEDGGEIREKEYLPVKALRFGDTGTPADEKLGRYTLGALKCEGDDLFNNVVTFRIKDATINLPPFDMGHSGDIYFEFKTTIEDAVILHAKGPTDFIKLIIVGGMKLLFEYQAGTGTQKVYVETAYKLNDDNWHSVSVERNRKEARLVVDGSIRAEVREPPGPVRALSLTSELVVGASFDYRDGFVGCIRALLLNGEQIDLRSYAQRRLYGVSTGCVGRCESNPCLNNGTCTERYDNFHCDCRWSAFKGPICADGGCFVELLFGKDSYKFIFRNRRQHALQFDHQVRLPGCVPIDAAREDPGWVHHHHPEGLPVGLFLQRFEGIPHADDLQLGTFASGVRFWLRAAGVDLSGQELWAGTVPRCEVLAEERRFGGGDRGGRLSAQGVPL